MNRNIEHAYIVTCLCKLEYLNSIEQGEKFSIKNKISYKILKNNNKNKQEIYPIFVGYKKKILYSRLVYLILKEIKFMNGK